ncbi:bck1-like resistance to osmotic shock [Tieghemiomyces parasiticus]|uniref:BRO domain-containing protein 1 n=1 Tax=Tieghemiomyces parasiticus TaxID=78921 RepID=A0A9W8DXJ8_9FUNG|nr:bck1-like resistance to osmotic shock [Tieghemiomyces parasiticus]
MAVQVPMIQVPWKRCEEVDWVLALRRYISGVLEQDPDSFNEQVYALHRMRQDTRGVNLDTTGRDLLYRYFSQLELLDLRFQLEKRPLELNFTWSDVFGRSIVTQPSLAFEKASIIFNMGAILSNLGTFQDRSEPDGLRRASHYFMFAASMMVFISENFIHAPSVDLNANTLKVLKELMLAQAQECFLEKSLQEQKKDTLIAKIASQTAWMYANVVESMGECLKNGIFEDQWLTVCQIKHRYYQTASQYHKGLAAESDGRYGEAVARLTLAETHAAEAGKLATAFVHSFDPNAQYPLLPDSATCLSDLAVTIRALVQEKLGMLTRDNDMIYHEAVPKTSILPPIDKVCMVKTYPLNEMYTTPGELQRVVGPDIFSAVVPMQVHESSSVYDEEKAKVVRQAMDRADGADTEHDAAFTFMQLPGSLDKFRSGEAQLEPALMSLADPPVAVREWAQQVASEEEAGGALQELIGTVENYRTQLRQTLDTAAIALDEEQRECEKNRVEFGDAWTQPPSGALSAPLRKDLRARREALDQAYAADSDTLARYQQFQPLFAVLRSGYHGDELESAFIEMVHNGIRKCQASLREEGGQGTLLDVGEGEAVDLTDHVDRIAGLVRRLTELRRERQGVLTELKDLVRDDDISHILLLNRRHKGLENQIFANELAKYQPFQDRILQNVEAQHGVVQSLSEAFRTLMELPEAGRIQSAWDIVEPQRDRLVTQLQEARDHYDEIKRNVQHGVTFYTNLVALANDLVGRIRRFGAERQEERERLTARLLQAKADVEQRQLRDQLDRYNQPAETSGARSSGETDSATMSRLAQQTARLGLGSPPLDPGRYALMTQEPLRRLSGGFSPNLPAQPSSPVRNMGASPVGGHHPQPHQHRATPSPIPASTAYAPPKSMHVMASQVNAGLSSPTVPVPRIPSCPESSSTAAEARHYAPTNQYPGPPPPQQPLPVGNLNPQGSSAGTAPSIGELIHPASGTLSQHAHANPADSAGDGRLANLFRNSPADNVPDVFKTVAPSAPPPAPAAAKLPGPFAKLEAGHTPYYLNPSAEPLQQRPGPPTVPVVPTAASIPTAPANNPSGINSPASYFQAQGLTRPAPTTQVPPAAPIASAPGAAPQSPSAYPFPPVAVSQVNPQDGYQSHPTYASGPSGDSTVAHQGSPAGPVPQFSPSARPVGSSYAPTYSTPYQSPPPPAHGSAFSPATLVNPGYGSGGTSAPPAHMSAYPVATAHPHTSAGPAPSPYHSSAPTAPYQPIGQATHPPNYSGHPAVTSAPAYLPASYPSVTSAPAYSSYPGISAAPAYQPTQPAYTPSSQPPVGTPTQHAPWYGSGALPAQQQRPSPATPYSAPALQSSATAPTGYYSAGAYPTGSQPPLPPHKPSGPASVGTGSSYYTASTPYQPQSPYTNGPPAQAPMGFNYSTPGPAPGTGYSAPPHQQQQPSSYAPPHPHQSHHHQPQHQAHQHQYPPPPQQQQPPPPAQAYPPQHSQPQHHPQAAPPHQHHQPTQPPPAAAAHYHQSPPQQQPQAPPPYHQQHPHSQAASQYPPPQQHHHHQPPPPQQQPPSQQQHQQPPPQQQQHQQPLPPQQHHQQQPSYHGQPAAQSFPGYGAAASPNAAYPSQQQGTPHSQPAAPAYSSSYSGGTPQAYSHHVHHPPHQHHHPPAANSGAGYPYGGDQSTAYYPNTAAGFHPPAPAPNAYSQQQQQQVPQGHSTYPPQHQPTTSDTFLTQPYSPAAPGGGGGHPTPTAATNAPYHSHSRPNLMD